MSSAARFLPVLIYLLGTFGQEIHLALQEASDPEATGTRVVCSVSSACDCPGPCQDPTHQPHARPPHDHTHCVICQQAFLTCDVSLASTTVVDLHLSRASPPEPSTTATSSAFISSHPTRGPPRIS